MFNGLFSLFIVAFSSLQTVAFMQVIDIFGYDGMASVQSDSAVFGIRVATGLIPLAALFLGLIPLAIYPFNKRQEDEISAFSNAARRGGTTLE